MQFLVIFSILVIYITIFQFCSLNFTLVFYLSKSNQKMFENENIKQCSGGLLISQTDTVLCSTNQAINLSQ